ncbi:tRNA glutamyl-Q(34) synthetase GluQRS [Dyella sp.]|uniref:tRNA glutamyl-Q(34) synthetase GluQRS n=1 Tax=Dyella sp. TaxID=1869338 RepID=UPI002ED1DB0F
MSYRGRFAPSPTGQLHFGSLVAAVGSWLCARQASGQWLVRVEDIDPPREVPGSAESILAALPAFGLVADEPIVRQSQRQAAYEAAFERLRDADLVFPCWCSRSDLVASGGLHRHGFCIATSDATRLPAWRLRVPDVEIVFDDGLQGLQRQRLIDTAGDFVIKRVEGLYAYQLACVVDDADQGITEVVRGNDLLDSTPRQIWLQRCLGLPTPTYRHLPLALDEQGRKLSKSAGAFPVDPTRPASMLQRALDFLNVRLRHRDIDDAHAMLQDALSSFDPRQLPRSNSRLA